MPATELRALIFFALSAEILTLILVNRSFNASLRDAVGRQNMALRYVISAIVIITAVILFWPRAQEILSFGLIAWSDMALALGIGITLLVLLEGCKPLVRRAFTRAKLARSEPHPISID